MECFLSVCGEGGVSTEHDPTISFTVCVCVGGGGVLEMTLLTRSLIEETYKRGGQF